MKKNANTENTASSTSFPNSGNRRKKKRGRKAASATKAATRAKTPSNSGTMKLVAQATKALNRANVFLGKIKF